MNPVNVLNASYEPLGVSKPARAISLVSSGRAVVDESHPEIIIRSAGGVAIPLPTTIRLVNYINVPFRYADESWSKAGVKRRDNYKCGYCGKKATTVDHITPKSRFYPPTEANTWGNTVACCHNCNSKKANNTPEECGMTLRIKPYTPTKMFISANDKYRNN